MGLINNVDFIKQNLKVPRSITMIQETTSDTKI